MYVVRLLAFFRQVWASLTTRFSIGAIILVVAITSLSGPLGTYEHIPSPLRWAVWFGLTAIAAVMYHSIDAVVEPFVRRANRLAHACVIATGMAAVYAPIALYLFERLNMSYGVPAPSLIMILVAFLATFTFDMFRELPEAAQNVEGHKILVDWTKLGVSRGGDLLAISADDHYVRVQTRIGEQRVLLRFGDALDMVALVEGMRVHRSHWVALSAIAGLEVTEGRHFIVLENGSRIPISKKRLEELPDVLTEQIAAL